MSNDSAYLLLIQTEKVKQNERESWDHFRDILADIRATGIEVAGEITADVSNACMDLEDLFC